MLASVMPSCPPAVYCTSPSLPAPADSPGRRWMAQGGGNGPALPRQLCWPWCGHGSMPPLPWDLLLSATFRVLSQPGAFHSSTCFQPFTFALLFPLARLPRHVSLARTFSCPWSWQDPSVPPTGMDSCHSTMGDMTFPPPQLLSPSPHQPFHPLAEGHVEALPAPCSTPLLPKADQGHCRATC